MNTHSIQFHDNIRKQIPTIFLNICFLELSKELRVRISHGKRAIGVRGIETLLCIVSNPKFVFEWNKAKNKFL